MGDNVTLTCRLTEGVPVARLSWLRGITQPEIQPGGRFLIAQEGNVSRLTIQNCSQGTDGGCYVCKAQNPVGLREMFVCLTVKREWGCLGSQWEAGTQLAAAVGQPPGALLAPGNLLAVDTLTASGMQGWAPSCQGEKAQPQRGAQLLPWSLPVCFGGRGALRVLLELQRGLICIC